jgi:hypothetical protein
VCAFEPEDSGLVSVAADLSRDGCFVELEAKGDEGGGELEIARMEEFCV